MSFYPPSPRVLLEWSRFARNRVFFAPGMADNVKVTPQILRMSKLSLRHCPCFFGKHNEELENLFICIAQRCILLHRFVRWRWGNNESVLCTAEDRRDSHRPEEEELAGSPAPAGGPRNPLKR